MTCSQDSLCHWPPSNRPGFCCSQELVMPSAASSVAQAVYWSPFFHQVSCTGAVQPTPIPCVCSDGATSIPQSSLLIWGLVRQPSLLCLKGRKWDARTLESHLLTLPLSFFPTHGWLTNAFSYFPFLLGKDVPCFFFPSVLDTPCIRPHGRTVAREDHLRQRKISGSIIPNCYPITNFCMFEFSVACEYCLKKEKTSEEKRKFR